MKTGELVLDALVADIWGVNEINIRVLNVKVCNQKIEDINVITGDCQLFRLKRSAENVRICVPLRHQK